MMKSVDELTVDIVKIVTCGCCPVDIQAARLVAEYVVDQQMIPAGHADEDRLAELYYFEIAHKAGL